MKFMLSGKSALIVIIILFTLLVLSYFTYNKKFIGIGPENPLDLLSQCICPDSFCYPKILTYIRENVLIPPPPELHLRQREPNKYHSQLGQDKLLYDKFFKNKTNGIFIEAGALDGIYLSNTLFFEETLGWTGLLVEPDPWTFEKLKTAKRNAWLLQGCLGSHRTEIQTLELNTNNGESGNKAIAYLENFGNKHVGWKSSVKNATTVEVNCYPLNLILDAIGWGHVDYFSLDVEGAEAAVLHSIDYSRHSFGVIDIECNECVNGKGVWSGRAPHSMMEKRYYIKKHLEYEGYREDFYKGTDIFYVPN